MNGNQKCVVKDVKNGSRFSSVNGQIGLMGLSDAKMLDGPRQENRSPFRRT